MRAATDPVVRPGRERHAEALARLGGDHPDFAADPAQPSLAMPSHSGLDGIASAAVANGSAVMVKTFHRDALAPFTFEGAVAATRLAGEAGIGPRLLAVDPVTATLVTERLTDPWRTASLPDFLSPRRIADLTALLRRWHGAGTGDERPSPLEEFRHLAARAAGPGALPLPATFGMAFAQLDQWVERICAALEASGGEVALLHGEMMLSNVLIAGDGALRMVDFDRAGMGDPWRDLGALSLELCVDDEDRHALLAAYLGQSPATDQVARLKLFALLDDAIWAIWALTGEASADRRGPELYKYASNRLVRFRHHLSLFDMAKLLREV